MMADDYPVTRFALLREADTVLVREMQLMGQNNDPLSEQGQEQAKIWAKVLNHFEWDRIITCEEGRPAETAAIINQTLNLPVIKDSRLKDRDWGSWAGKTEDQLNETDSELLAGMEEAGWKFCPPGGESNEEVMGRVSAVLKDAHQNNPDKNVLIVTHEGPIKILVYRMLEQLTKEERKSFIILSNQMHRLYYHGDELKLEKMNALPLP